MSTKTFGTVCGTALVVAWAATASAQQPKTGTTPPAAGPQAEAAPAPPPVDSAAPAPVPPVEPAATVPVPDSGANAKDEDEGADEDEQPRRKKKRGRGRWRDGDDSASSREGSEDESEDASPSLGDPLQLGGTRFIVSVERATSVLAWAGTTTITNTSFNQFGDPTTSDQEVESSGTDVSFLGGNTENNPFAIPRVAFDAMLNSGLTLGGSLTYLTSSSKAEIPSDLDPTVKTTVDGPTRSTFILSPRIGVMLKASPTVGIWLRGGITRVSVTSETKRSIDDVDGTREVTTTGTGTFVNVSLDPQLVLMPVPHVGITLGAAVDIGASGTYKFETSGSPSQEVDQTLSSYGATAGLVAIF